MSTRHRPLVALAGVAFCLLGIAGTLAYPSDPGFAAAPPEIAAFYTENDGALLAANTLYLLAGSVLLVFTGYLRSAVARAEGGDHRLASIVFAGGVAGAALSIGAASLDVGAALRVDEQGTISPDVAPVMWDAGHVLYGLAAPMALAVLVLATAVAARRTGLLPTWHVALSGLLGVALLAPPINHVAVIAFTFWALVTGGVLYMAGDEAAERVAVSPATA
jgi:hypothetical protein